jgi:glycerophosphodiester phosphodiesterase
MYFTSKPIVSAHRGGGGEQLKGYPENCLESIQYLSKKGIHSFEIDIFESADGDLLLMHDDKLGRTATGQGVVSALTTAQLRTEKLKDEFGNVTAFQIPFLKDVLSWCKTHKGYLMLDFKKGISYQKVVDLVREEKMEAQVVLISYNTAQAEALHKVAPEMLLSVSARNEDELNRILQTGIPKQKLLAFTGIRLAPDQLYERLNQLKIPAILGTLGNLDKRAATKGDHLYTEWAKKGIQVFSTDRPLAFK